MTEILPIFIVSCTLAWFSNVFSSYDDYHYRYIKKEKIFFTICVFLIIIFVGMRTQYNDTLNYLQSYTIVLPDDPSLFYRVNFSDIGDNPGFRLIQNVLKKNNFSEQSFILFFSVITYIPLAKFIDKYSHDRFFTIYLLFTLGYVTFTLAAIKQVLAISIGLIALDKYLEKKYIRSVLWILIAITIHPYVGLFILAPFLTYKPWTKKTGWLLGIFFVVGISLQFFLGGIINITSMMGEEYTVEMFSGEGVNPFRVIVSLVPLALSYFVRNNIREEEYNETTNIFINFSMLNGLIMFIALFGTANYFGRLSHYFLIFSIIMIPFLLKHVDERCRSLVIIVALVCYFGYFYYQNVYGGAGNFNLCYDKVSFFDYIKTL